MIDIDTSSRKEQRNFGLVMGAAFAVLGLIRWGLHGFEGFPWIFFSIGAVFAVLGLVAPPVLKPVFVAWMKLATVLNWIMTRVFLGVAFFLLITPVRLIIKVFAEDPLKRAWRPEAESYWEEPDEQPKDIRRYKNQF